MRVTVEGLRWQNTATAANARASGVYGLGLLLAWFFFVWLLAGQIGFAELGERASPLLRSVLDKGYYATDLGMIVLGFLAFHRVRELRLKWDRAVARKLYLRLLRPLLVYALLSLAAFEIICMIMTGGLINPWTDKTFAPVCHLLAVMLVGLPALPWLICVGWVSMTELMYAFLLMSLSYYGTCFYFGVSHVGWLWSVHLPVAFVFGVVCCSMFFRGGQYLVAVRGPMVIIGWFVLIGGSILAGPFLFYLGFVMILAGAVMNERIEPNWIETPIRGWARTGLGIFLAAPTVFALGTGLGLRSGMSLPVAALVLALLTQLLGLVFYLAAEPALTLLSRARPARA